MFVKVPAYLKDSVSFIREVFQGHEFAFSKESVKVAFSYVYRDIDLAPSISLFKFTINTVLASFVTLLDIVPFNIYGPPSP